MHLVGLEAKSGGTALALVGGDWVTTRFPSVQEWGVKDKNDQEQRTCEKSTCNCYYFRVYVMCCIHESLQSLKQSCFEADSSEHLKMCYLKSQLMLFFAI